MNKVIPFIFSMLFMSGMAIGQESAQKEVWTLEECIEYALENNLDVQRSVLTVSSSEVDWKQAKLQRYPNFNASGSYGSNWGRSIDPVTNLFTNQQINSVNFGASSDVTVFNGFSVNNDIKQNSFNYQASVKELEVTKNNVMLNIVGFYTNVLFTRELMQNAEKQLNSIEQQTERTRIQVDAGALPQASLLDLQSQRATQELNLVNAENNYVQAKIQLKLAMQLPPEVDVEIEVPEIDVNANLVQELSALEIYDIALATMPEIQSADLSLEGSSHGLKAAKGRRYPSFFIRGNVFTNYSDRITERSVQVGDEVTTRPIGFVEGTNQTVLTVIPLTSQENFGFSEQMNENLSQSLTVGINVPIFNRGQFSSQIQRAEITQDRAEINKQDREYQLWQQIQQSYNDVYAASKSYNASLLAVEASKESYRVLTRQFNNGAANFVDYLVSENTYFQAESDLLRAKYDLIFKQKILDFYQGKPLEF